MANDKKEYIVFIGENGLEYFCLILWGWLGKRRLLLTSPDIYFGTAGILKKIPSVRNYIKEFVKEFKGELGDCKGLWYEVSQEAIDLTLNFHDREMRGEKEIINYYNRMFVTDKFEAYAKKVLSQQIFSVLRVFHFLRRSPGSNHAVLMSRTPVNEYVAEYARERYRLNCRVRWTAPARAEFALGAYYKWLLKEFILRGAVFNRKRKYYKLSKEAAWGFYRPTLRDDIVIDNNRFRPKDVLLLKFCKTDYFRNRASEEAGKRGFDIASVRDLSINIDRRIFACLFFYFAVPLNIYFRLIAKRRMYFIDYALSFHRACFPIEALMRLYSIGCYISSKDWGDVAETIMFNKYGTRTAIFHWSDMTVFKDYLYSFLAHNVYFAWGDIHYDFHSRNCFVDKKLNIGCIFKGSYSRALDNRKRLLERLPGIKNGRKTVVFFDTSFDNAIHFTNSFFLEYMKVVGEFCRENKNINVLLKPKKGEHSVLKYLRGEGPEYRNIVDGLIDCDNFSYLDPLEWSVEEVISLADVCVTMGMTTPSTLALICGKSALYFDTTRNSHHPFAQKHKGVVVFDDKDALFRQIDNVLTNNIRCESIIGKEGIRSYDAFEDDASLERLRGYLHDLTAFNTEKEKGRNGY